MSTIFQNVYYSKNLVESIVGRKLVDTQNNNRRQNVYEPKCVYHFFNGRPLICPHWPHVVSFYDKTLSNGHFVAKVLFLFTVRLGIGDWKSFCAGSYFFQLTIIYTKIGKRNISIFDTDVWNRFVLKLNWK